MRPIERAQRFKRYELDAVRPWLAPKDLLVVAPEWQNARWTGMGPITCSIVEILHSANLWEGITVALPKFGNRAQSAPRDFELVEIGHSIATVDQHGFAHPDGREVNWQGFNVAMIDLARSLTRPFDVLSFNWPTSPFVRDIRLARASDPNKIGNIVMSLDLLPPRQHEDDLIEAVRMADVIHVPTQEWADTISESVNLKNAESEVRIQPIAYPVNCSPGTHLRRGDQSRCRILFAGRFSRDDQKDWSLAIDIAECLLDRHTDVEFVFKPLVHDEVLRGSLVYEKFRRLIRRFPTQAIDASEASHSLGWHDLVISCDIFLFLSKFEPFAVTIVEALQSGAVPVGISRGVMTLDSFRDIRVDHSQGNCFLTSWDPNDVHHSHGELIKTLDDAIAFWRHDEDWSRIRQNARELGNEFFPDNLLGSYTLLFHAGLRRDAPWADLEAYGNYNLFWGPETWSTECPDCGTTVCGSHYIASPGSTQNWVGRCSNCGYFYSDAGLCTDFD
jgi:hypothetical protein